MLILSSRLVPYMYLPSSSCSAIAQHLPVTFDSDLGLYIWNTNDPAFEKIVSSPHYISFTFAPGSSSESNSTIYVPFAVLNLTLPSHVVSTPVQYFPCSPYSPNDGTTYHLGRAFLQATYLAQNWQASRLLLSEAPGPDIAKNMNQDVKTTASTDITITPMVKAPAWNATWTTKLEALAENATSPASASTTTDPKSSAAGLSGGAIAGVVIGAVAALVLVAVLTFLLIRRRNRRNAAVPVLTEWKNQAPVASEQNPWSSNPPQGVAEAPDGTMFEAASSDRPRDKQIYEVPSAHKVSYAPVSSLQMERDVSIGELEGNGPDVPNERRS